MKKLKDVCIFLGTIILLVAFVGIVWFMNTLGSCINPIVGGNC